MNSPGRNSGCTLNLRRSNIDIIGDILTVGESGVQKTESDMMSSINLSYSQIQKYMSFLVGHGFVNQITAGNPSAAYLVTEKGMYLLNTIRNTDVLSDDIYFESATKHLEMPGTTEIRTETESQHIPDEINPMTLEIPGKDDNLPPGKHQSALDKAANGIELALDKLGDALVYPIEKIANLITALSGTTNQKTRGRYQP